MENLGYYLNNLKEWFIEGWNFLFQDTRKVQAHHLIAFLLTILIVYLLSYIVSRIFTTLIKICVLIALAWLVWMFLFDRNKFNELFCKEDHKKNETPAN